MRIRACPACGDRVLLTDALPASVGPIDDEARLDRLAHALCGCYVLTMPHSGVARLLYSVVSEPDAADRLTHGGAGRAARRYHA